MQYSRFLMYGVIVATTIGTTAAGAQETNPAKRDTMAINALTRMGTYLRSLNTFQVRATISKEEVLQDGQKIQSTSMADVVAERPTKMFVNITEDRQPRELYYDGKTFTMWAPRVKFYASIDAPPSINELVTKLEDKYDIQVPLVDLFRWGTSDADLSEITGALFIGPAVIDGITCEHYAFRQPGLDWQVWMQAGDFPLPRKVVLTTLTDDARPQHEAMYVWNLAPSYTDDAFTFAPPKDAKKITIAEVAASRVAKKNGEKK